MTLMILMTMDKPIFIKELILYQNFIFTKYSNIHKTVTKQSNIIIKQYYCMKKRLKC